MESGFYLTGTRYYDSVVGGFINADDTDVLDGSNDHMLENNLFAYCFNNPVNMTDEDGAWPKWATTAIKIGIGVVAIGIGVAATVATGGATAPALIGALQMAGLSVAIGAGTGAVTSAVTHRVSTGNWKGTGKAALDGAVNGAVDGFMTGGIMAGGSQLVSAGFKVAAKMGVQTGVKGGVKLTKNVKILSPDAAWHKNNGGTLLKIGKTFRVDVGSNTLLHAHFPGHFANKHFPIGAIASGSYGGFKQWK